MARLQPNRFRYLSSLAEELHAQSTRVRDLIGDAHWYYDGHHKEYLLVDLLRRHLPNGMLASRGFVISPTDPERRSSEQDILVVDISQEAPVMNQGGVIIVFPRLVRAAISVKTTMDSKAVNDTVKGLNSVLNLTLESTDSRSVWCGAYYFEVDPPIAGNPSLVYGHISRAMSRCPVTHPVPAPAHPWPLGPDLHCSAKDFAYKLAHGYRGDTDTVVGPRLLGYRCHGLATALFLGGLLDHVAIARGTSDADFSDFVDGDGIVPLDTPTKELDDIAVPTEVR